MEISCAVRKFLVIALLYLSILLIGGLLWWFCSPATKDEGSSQCSMPKRQFKKIRDSMA